MGVLDEVIEYLIDRYDINISTQNYIRNRLIVKDNALIMKNIEKERLEAKLRLWETPGFSQFLEDLSGEIWATDSVSEAVHIVRDEYLKRLKEIEETEEGSKFKQTKLDL